MIFDHRIYTCRPGTVGKQLQIYAEHGYAVQTRHLGEPVLYGITETGPINSYIHVWAYEDAADRAQAPRRHAGGPGMAGLPRAQRREPGNVF